MDNFKCPLGLCFYGKDVCCGVCEKNCDQRCIGEYAFCPDMEEEENGTM